MNVPRLELRKFVYFQYGKGKDHEQNLYSCITLRSVTVNFQTASMVLFKEKKKKTTLYPLI